MHAAFTAFAALLPVALAIAAEWPVGATGESRSANERYLFPAKGVDPSELRSDSKVTVVESEKALSFTPTTNAGLATLLFFPGGGVDPKAYAPTARGLAAKGWTVDLVKLPGGFSSAESRREAAISLGKAVMEARSGVSRWVVGGHSMGAAIAARFVFEEPKRFKGMILVATTHPRDFDISTFQGEAVKVYGTEDRVAPQAKSDANKQLLPAKTKWVRIEGGNHAQFGSYGVQPGDGPAKISEEKQRRQTIEAIAETLQRASEQSLHPQAPR
jgi:pimeloyl-ACP methyl ester carboxylesterase